MDTYFGGIYFGEYSNDVLAATKLHTRPTKHKILGPAFTVLVITDTQEDA